MTFDFCKSLEILERTPVVLDTLQQLLSTWTAHNLSHIAQITRVMCKQYQDEVGPWIEYLGILTRY